jgi:hypothetical protein
MAAAQSRHIASLQTPDPAEVEPTLDGEEPNEPQSPTTEAGAETSGVEQTPTTGAPEKAAEERLDVQLLRDAVAAGIPIAQARGMHSNADLLEFIQVMGGVREEQQEAAESEGRRLAKEVADALVIPEGELDLSDPKDLLINTLVESQKKLADMLGGTFDATQKVGKLRERDIAAQQHDAEVREFDSVIDSLGQSDFYKESASPERIEVWNTYKGLLIVNPNAKKAELMARAQRATHPELGVKAAEAKQQAAVTAQNAAKLGGGKTAPAAVTPPTPKDLFLAKLKEANARAIAKRGY